MDSNQFVFILVLLPLIIFSDGCSSRANDETKWGAATISELAEKYAQAHIAKDLKAMCYLDESYRGVWRSPPMGWPGEKSLVGIMNYHLERVYIELFPPPNPLKVQNVDYTFSNEVFGHQSVSGFTGTNMYGRLILIGKNDASDSSGSLPRKLDPALIIVKNNNRFFIHFSPGILDEAARSVRAGTPPRYTSGPCVTLN